MVGTVNRLRSFIRDYFTRKCIAVDGMPFPSAQDTTRKGKRIRTRSVPPSESFVWAMFFLLVAVAGWLRLKLLSSL